MGTVITWVLNFILGIIVTAIIASQISSGQGISFEDGIKLNLKLYNMGLILYLVFIVAYFVGSKKFLGKTPGAIITEKILGKKK
ncbi:MAG: hypothetical protein Q7R77_02050 [Candidatus Daviesbacteria bacterium]|nr:hypothetical protein [Candidatus Daviesbacteria bacterium]